MAIKTKVGKLTFKDDEKRELMMMMAAADEDPETYGDMDDEEEKKYRALVAEMRAHPDAEWDIPYDDI